MHIEKNVCDSVLGTLLDIPGKTKDHLNARLDLKKLKIRTSLHPVESTDKRYVLLPKASFSMSKEEKKMFCEVLKNAKLPQGCASNLGRCVQMQEGKIAGYKSHDAHILMQYLLQVAVRKTLQDLDRLESEIAEILCMFERIFPPSFFDIMIHLPIHLVNKVRLSGPVNGWWMYPIERYLGKLKSYVRNRSRPEGSIAEGYLAEECLIFCSRYLHDGVKKRSKNFIQNYEKGATDDNSPIFPKIGYPLGKRKKGQKGRSFSLDLDIKDLAHRYELFNCKDKDAEKYIKEHEDLMENNSKHKQRKRWRQAQQHSQKFMVWLKEKVESVQVPDHIKWLSMGPSCAARRFVGYFINSYRFYTRNRDARCKTQNSGVTLTALTSSFASTKDINPILDSLTYYGAISEIIELDYWGSFSVVSFRCDWFHVEKDEYGLTRVNFKRLCCADDPFVLASQVHQVFYVKDPIEDDWHYVMKDPIEDDWHYFMKKLPKEFFGIEEQTEDAYLVEPYDDDRTTNMVDNDDATEWCREGVPHTMVERHPDELTKETSVDTHANNSDIDDTNLEWMDF